MQTTPKIVGGGGGIIKILNKYLCYKRSLEMWNLIFSIIVSFEIEDKSQDRAETWEPRCRLIQDENRMGEEGKEGLLLLS